MTASRSEYMRSSRAKRHELLSPPPCCLPLPISPQATACCSLSSLSADHLSETEALLARRFGASGGLLAVYVPRLPSGWDPGVAALTFADGESAEAARLLLDGAPSHVAGDELTALRHAPRAGAGEGLSEAGAREIEALRLLRCEEHEI